LFQRDNIVASAALPKILILNSTCYIYIYGIYVTIPNPKRFSQIYRGNHMDNCERTRTSIHPARRKDVCKRQRHSIAKGWKIARRQPETIPKNTSFMDAKETSRNHPQSWWVYGGCPHSFELGELFSHIQLFVMIFCLFTTNIGALNQKKRAYSSLKWPRILTAHLFSPGEIGRQPPALADAVDELGQLGSGAGEGGS